MPVPGRPRNAGGYEPRFHRTGQDAHADTRFRTGAGVTRFSERPQIFVPVPGHTPGLQDVHIRAHSLAFGTIRRLWRQAINYIPGPPPFNQTENHAEVTGVVLVGRLTRALRYKASSVYRQAGTSNTRFGELRPIVPPQSGRHGRPVTVAAGNLQGRPVLRSRLSSFGSRVPPVNRR